MGQYDDLRYINLFATMLIGGFWHGASWNFVIWGAIHGFALALNHLLRDLKNSSFDSGIINSKVLTNAAGRITTMTVVIFAWVFFRADTVGNAISLLTSLFHQNNALSLSDQSLSVGFNFARALRYFSLFGFIAFFCPNSLTILKYLEHSVGANNRSLIHFGIAVVVGLLTTTCLIYSLLGSTSEFLYFQF